MYEPIGVVLGRLADDGPTVPALTTADVTRTRAELDVRTNRLGRSFLERGAAPGAIVAVSLPNGSAVVESVVAAWKLGAVPLVLSAAMPAAERAAVLELAASSSGGCLVVDDPAAAEPPDGDGSRLPTATPPYWRASTSGGSTGRPKLILSSKPGIADPDERTFYLRREGCTVVPGPLYHGAPFLIAANSLFRGKHVVLLPKFGAESTLAAVERHRADYLPLVPTMMSRIWKLPDDVKARVDLSSLQVVLHFGSSCPVWLKQAWIDWLGPERIHELYAGTEGQATTWIKGTEWVAHPGSVGRPANGAEMRAFGVDMAILPAGEIGEIYMKPPPGTPRTYEYVGAEAKSQGEWESLGDMGWIDDDGYVYIADRRTDMIVTGGANVYPAEVEAALEQHPDVRTAVVVGLPDGDLGHRIHAIVEGSPTLTADALATFMADRLVRYKIPRTFEVVDAPLRDEAGKVRRSVLRDARAGSV
ncbi:MAG: AMP-binding protein [Ilumatobacteraceae bacterium]